MSFRRFRPLNRVLFSHFFLSTLGFALLLTACGGTAEQPTVASFSARLTPTPPPSSSPGIPLTPLTPTTPPAPDTPTPTTAATPTPEPSAVPITDWELDENSTGGDLENLLSEDERSCLKAALGDQHDVFLSMTYFQLWNETTGPVLGDCLTQQSTVGLVIAQYSATAGGLSADTRSCLAGAFTADPQDALVLSAGAQPGSSAEPASFDVLSCLTPEEAAAMTPEGEGPPPDTEALRCLTEELMKLDGGDEVVRIMSTADPAGLTLEQSALLGQAVQACDIETELTFPDPGSTGSADDAETTDEAEGSEDGSGSADEGTG